MNERMIDIAMKANDQTGNEFDLNHKPLDAFLAKFAELIVRECAERLLNDAKLTDIQTTRCVASIREHFGVER